MSNNKGFTLTEILLAMFITSILVLGIHAAYQQAHKIWSKTEQSRPIYADARRITETLRNELSCLYMPPVSEEDEKCFVLASEPDGSVDMIFYTLGPAYLSNVGTGRIAKVRYNFSRDRQTDELILYRYEQECAGEKVIGTEISRILTKQLMEFKLSVYVSGEQSGKSDWQKSHMSATEPPAAIKVMLRWPEDANSSGYEFATTIFIPCQASLQP